MEVFTILLPFLWSGLIALYAVPSVIDLAHHKGLMDSIEKRKIHTKLTPRLGGVAIFAGTFSGILIFAQVDLFMQYFLAGVLILFFIGVKDDLQEIKAWKKLVVQFLVTFLVIYESNFALTSLKGLFGLQWDSEFILITISILSILIITNAINFIDGIDGLAASLCIIAALVLAFYFLPGNPALGITLICLSGSLIGFLRYNLKKSLVFMGDSGSLVSGFILAILSLKFVEAQQDSRGFALVFAILFIPLADFGRVMLARIFAGKSPFSPGRDHIHHLLVDSGYSLSRTLGILVSLNMLATIAGILWVAVFHLDPNRLIFAFFVLSIILSIYCEFGLKKNSS